jgi:phosphopantothenoylcysteine decarboxylase/phosphopantothenate--cysteine ligase
MESAMFAHPATQEHLNTLRRRGAIIIGPESGHLASGAKGPGRMTEPLQVADRILSLLDRGQDLTGRRILVTAGPTNEPIDSVRFIGNRSSGKMGFAIAEEAAGRGADVDLIAGPTSVPAPTHVNLLRVETSAQMLDAVLERARQSDVIIMAAAVADFRPTQTAEGKLRRSDGLTLELGPTEDIAAAAVAANPRALHIGFALESDNLVEAARAKLHRKHQTLVVGNLISPDHNPFGADQNQVVFVTADSVREFPSLPKREVARLLLDEIAARLTDAASVSYPEDSRR